MAFNLERNKGKVDEIKQNIEAKKSELAKLEENKEKLMDAGSDIQGSEIDEEVQETIMEQINRALEEKPVCRNGARKLSSSFCTNK